MTNKPFNIKPGTANGKACFIISGKLNGVFVRKYAPTMPEAVAIQTAQNALLFSLPAPAMQHTTLTPAQARQAEQAFGILRDGVTLPECVQYFNVNYAPALKPLTVQEAHRLMLADYLKRGKRPDTLRNLRGRLSGLVKLCPASLVHEITEAQLRGLIFKAGLSAVTEDNNRRVYSSFFSWCVGVQACVKNPMESIKPGEWDVDAPEAYSVADVRRLLASARDYKGGKLVPYLVLGLFCGMRPTEIERLGAMGAAAWEVINLEAKASRLDEKICKLRARRVVELVTVEAGPAKVCNVAEWLAPHKLARTIIAGVNWRKDFEAVKNAAGFSGSKRYPADGFKPWIQDGLRHTAISHHLAQFENEGKTATWAGNSPGIIHANYKALVDRAQAAEFWQITPANVAGKILALPQGKAVAA